MLIEKSVEFQLPGLAIFVDFKAAFDSIHRPSMWQIFAEYGIPVKYIQLIRCVYENYEAAVIVEGERTDWFRVETTVRQGCVRSPLLFGVMIDFVLRKSCDKPSTGICLRARRLTLLRIEQSWHLTDLDYADDVTLLGPISNTTTKALGFGETRSCPS